MKSQRLSSDAASMFKEGGAPDESFFAKAHTNEIRETKEVEETTIIDLKKIRNSHVI